MTPLGIQDRSEAHTPRQLDISLSAFVVYILTLSTFFTFDRRISARHFAWDGLLVGVYQPILLLSPNIITTDYASLYPS